MLDHISDETKGHYLAIRDLPDGRTIGVHRLMFHFTLHVDFSDTG